MVLGFQILVLCLGLDLELLLLVAMARYKDASRPKAYADDFIAFLTSYVEVPITCSVSWVFGRVSRSVSLF
jgi:hypothetical protein